MRNPNSRMLLIVASAIAIYLAGCKSGSQVGAGASEAASAAPEVTEAQQVAESILGKDAQVLAHGDLAKNGKEQVLAVNRQQRNDAPVSGDAAPIYVTRAAILEKNGDKWNEILLCDENLKNPRGYLGGTPLDPISGWELQVGSGARQDMELRFTAAANAKRGAFVVRWNPKTKLYQTFDSTNERFLSESVDQEISPSHLQ